MSVPRTAGTAAVAPRRVGGMRAPMQLTELRAGQGATVVRDLRRQEAIETLVLTRRAGRRELVTLLTGGVRGAVAVEAPGAVLIMTRHSPERPALPLSDRELWVLSLVAGGNTNDAVGRRMGVSGLTVKSHLARIARKLGTGDRAEMVALAIRRRLIP